jgi:hypothetical protein
MHPSKEERPVSEKIIVLVSDRGDSKHGEVSVLDDPEKAERLVETLLEAGFEPERIRVFSGRASEFEISHRPVVALMAEGEEGEPQARAESPVEQTAPVTATAKAAPQAEAGAEMGEEEAVAAGAEMAAPVRFSSLFRSA